ncbi:hypothetical protein BRADI_3g00446v3 [Brachypodium distachyon]|uniref:Uncharacterized protein n=1 Tax=Brachypodium distachyon TaxID=15368 RepID=A0A0Q3F2M3_BRADI|nr:hypothetical protein BRADI_3g00446v3 [Brachypodium distachyon]
MNIVTRVVQADAKPEDSFAAWVWPPSASSTPVASARRRRKGRDLRPASSVAASAIRPVLFRSSEAGEDILQLVRGEPLSRRSIRVLPARHYASASGGRRGPTRRSGTTRKTSRLPADYYQRPISARTLRSSAAWRCGMDL